VVDLSSSSDGEGLIPDTSRDEEFIKRLFDDLKYNILGPSDDDKVIILSDSDEDEEEVQEEDATDAIAGPSSAARVPASTAPAADVDEISKGMQDDNSDGLAPDREIGDSSSGEDEVGSP
jgi:hypothetical protein